jgi:hypothetical protein
VAALVETKRSKGHKRDLAAAIDKFAKMKKSEKNNAGGVGSSARGDLQRDRRDYNGVRTPGAAPFPVYLPTPSAPSTSGYLKAGAEAGCMLRLSGAGAQTWRRLL